MKIKRGTRNAWLRKGSPSAGAMSGTKQGRSLLCQAHVSHWSPELHCSVTTGWINIGTHLVISTEVISKDWIGLKFKRKKKKKKRKAGKRKKIMFQIVFRGCRTINVKNIAEFCKMDVYISNCVIWYKIMFSESLFFHVCNVKKNVRPVLSY